MVVFGRQSSIFSFQPTTSFSFKTLFQVLRTLEGVLPRNQPRNMKPATRTTHSYFKIQYPVFDIQDSSPLIIRCSLSGKICQDTFAQACGNLTGQLPSIMPTTRLIICPGSKYFSAVSSRSSDVAARISFRLFL